MAISRQVPPPTPLTVFTVPARTTTTVRDVGVIIVAAGGSTRVGDGELKQFRWIAGKPMLLHSVQRFLARADVCAVVCVLPAAYVPDPPPWLLQNDLDRLLLSVGGRTRTASVRNGLDDLVPEAKIVLVHDAARPFVTDAMVDRVIAETRRGHVAIAALPVIDTLKEADSEARVRATVDRANLWRAQTPQGFPREVIDRVYRDDAATDATDDAVLAERAGIPVVLVRGDERALKITEPDDFRRAEVLATLDDESGGARA